MFFFPEKTAHRHRKLMAADPEMASWANPLNTGQAFLRPYIQGEGTSLDLPNSEPIQQGSQMEMALKTNNE